MVDSCAVTTLTSLNQIPVYVDIDKGQVAMVFCFDRNLDWWILVVNSGALASLGFHMLSEWRTFSSTRRTEDTLLVECLKT